MATVSVAGINAAARLLTLPLSARDITIPPLPLLAQLRSIHLAVHPSDLCSSPVLRSALWLACLAGRVSARRDLSHHLFLSLHSCTTCKSLL